MIFAPSAIAVAPAAWKETAYTYDAKGKPLIRVLNDFGGAMGARVVIQSPLGASMPGGRIAAPSAIDYLDRLAIDNGFSWYFYNNALFINPISDYVTARIEMPSETMPDAQRALQSIGLLDPRFGWGELPDQGVVLVSGPTSYVDLVRQLLKADDKGLDEKETQIMVFRLKNASAMDRSFTIRDTARVVPGVASVLRTVLNGDTSSLNSDLRRETQQLMAGAGSRGAAGISIAGATGGLSSGGGGSSLPMLPPTTGSGPLGPPSRSDSAARGARPTQATIGVDARLNAVLIRDLPKRRELYESLISQLDVASPLVEITAYIIDVTKDELNEWVPELAYQGWAGTTRFNAGTSPGAFTPQVAAAGLGGNIALLATNRFLLNLRALEAKKHARVLSRPSVLTMDNVQAVLDLSHTSYIKLIGERNVDARSISAGLMFQVTPRVVDNTIHLDVDVEDGEIENSGEGNSNPLVSRKAISTQAVIRENQVLIIGGYRRSRTGNDKGGVPLIGDIPLVGKLFQSNMQEQNDIERLYVLSARAVNGADANSMAPEALPSMPPLISNDLQSTEPR